MHLKIDEREGHEKSVDSVFMLNEAYGAKIITCQWKEAFLEGRKDSVETAVPKR